tara:strand:- start:658 stop:1074 length:417 start_codon:yes stop_codon:yes gene_type:complete
MHFNIGENTENYIYTPIVRDNLYFTASTAYYGMKLNHIDTNVSKKIIVEDVSNASDAFQKFQLINTGSTSEVLSGGIVNLKTGTHEYTFYPSTSQSLSDIGTKVLGRGYLEVTATTETISEYTDADEASGQETIVYGE